MRLLSPSTLHSSAVLSLSMVGGNRLKLFGDVFAEPGGVQPPWRELPDYSTSDGVSLAAGHALSVEDGLCATKLRRPLTLASSFGALAAFPMRLVLASVARSATTEQLCSFAESLSVRVAHVVSVSALHGATRENPDPALASLGQHTTEERCLDTEDKFTKPV